MNQLENDNGRRGSSAGRSRGRSSDRNPGAGRSAGAGHTGRSPGGSSRSQRSGSSYRSGGQAGRMNAANTYRRNGAYRKRKGPDYKKIAIGGVILLILITCIALAVNAKKAGDAREDESTAQPTETEVVKEVRVDGISIAGMSQNQAKNAILKEYPWSMTVTYGEYAYEVADLMAPKVDELLAEIYSGEPKEQYTLELEGLEEAAAAQAAQCAAKWDKKAKNGSIDKFDKEKGEFVFAGEAAGFAIDQEKLAADILGALKEKKFDAEIAAGGQEVQPDISAATAREKYKTISTFTTDTTANSNRNNNVKLSADALNGTVVHPGEEFSFNGTVGRRTEEKGYKGAAAYNNGLVVQEIGGGVCQVSTTLYNAVYRSGLGEESITFRRSHTFEPNYVTPGQDATVSFEQPDFRFKNTSSTSIGIRASYSKQKMTVSIYGIPILEEGMKLDLESKKTETLDPPAPTYEEDQTLQPGVEVPKSAGSSGSRWETYKVVYKDGEEISRTLDHKTTYKGHAPVFLRNTSGIVLTPDETTVSNETPVPTIDGMPEGYIPGNDAALPGDGTTQEIGPGVDNTAPTVPATQAAAPPQTPGTQAPGTQAPGAQAPGIQPPPGSSESSTGNGPIVAPPKPE